jgi:hypothetical protein
LFRRHAAGKERERHRERGRRSYRHVPGVGEAAFGGLEAHDAAQRGGHPDGPAPVHAQRDGAQTTAADPLDDPPATLPTLYGFLVDLHTITEVVTRREVAGTVTLLYH